MTPIPLGIWMILLLLLTTQHLMRRYLHLAPSASAPPLPGPVSPLLLLPPLPLITKTYSQSPPPPHQPPPPPSSLTRTVKWESEHHLHLNNSQSLATPISPAGLEREEQQPPQASSKPQESSTFKEQEPPHSQMALPLPMAASSCPQDSVQEVSEEDLPSIQAPPTASHTTQAPPPLILQTSLP